jgi:hypothetical protein
MNSPHHYVSVILRVLPTILACRMRHAAHSFATGNTPNIVHAAARAQNGQKDQSSDPG